MIENNLSQARPASNNKLNGISNNYGWGQPLLFSPSELIRCGLRDAHNFPLVGQRYEDGGIRAWREPPEIAWARQLIELGRTATSYAGLVFDCDSRESIELAAGACGGTGPVPPPNFASARKASGHFQVGYFLGPSGAPRRGGAGAAARLPRSRLRILPSGARGRSWLRGRSVLQSGARRLLHNLSAL